MQSDNDSPQHNMSQQSEELMAFAEDLKRNAEDLKEKANSVSATLKFESIQARGVLPDDDSVSEARFLCSLLVICSKEMVELASTNIELSAEQLVVFLERISIAVVNAREDYDQIQKTWSSIKNNITNAIQKLDEDVRQEITAVWEEEAIRIDIWLCGIDADCRRLLLDLASQLGPTLAIRQCHA